jgi:DNA-binding MarR family transcriptional regulator
MAGATGRDRQAMLARLRAELALNRDFVGTHEAAFLAMAWTWQRLEAVGREFFQRFGLTDVQFNVLMILDDYRDRSFKQHELADILVVNRASIGGVLERMQARGWIDRVTDAEDRRAQRVRLTRAGRDKLAEVRKPYYRQLASLFEGVGEAALQDQIAWYERLRRRIDQLEAPAA